MKNKTDSNTKKKNLLLIILSLIIFFLGIAMFGFLKIINAKGYSTAISAMTAETEEVNQMMENFLKPTTDMLLTVNKWYGNDLISINEDEKFASMLIPLLSQYSQINGFILMDSQEQLIMITKQNDHWISYTIKQRIMNIGNTMIESKNSCKIATYDQNGKKISSSMKIIPQDLKDLIEFPDNNLNVEEEKVNWEISKREQLMNNGKIVFSQQWLANNKVIKASISFEVTDIITKFSSIPFSEHFQIFMINKLGEGINIFSGEKVPKDFIIQSEKSITKDWNERGKKLISPVRIADLGLLYYIQPFSGDNSIYLGIILYEQLMKERVASSLSGFNTVSFVIAGIGLAMFFISIIITRKEDVQLGIYSLPKNEEEWKKLISNGENTNLEFKSTMRWDMVKSCKNTSLENVIIKTVGAFSNSEGGILIIGIEDNGNILGLENDYSTLPKQNKDGFELHLRELLNGACGISNTAKNIKTEFPILDEKEICAVIIYPSTSPIYTKIIDPKKGKTEKFYIRSGNSSRELEQISDVTNYIMSHFKNKKKLYKK